MWRSKGMAQRWECSPRTNVAGFKSGCQCHMWVEFVVGSILCSERFFLRVLRFSPLLKTNICKFSFDQESGQRRTTMQMCYLQIIIYLFRGEEQGCAIVAPGHPLGRLLHCKIIFRLVHTYLDIFENGEYFLLWKKFMSTHTCSISKSFFAHPYKKGKTMEINRVHLTACVLWRMSWFKNSILETIFETLLFLVPENAIYVWTIG